MPRDTRYTNNEPDGTPFQELIMFPTLAPQLARPQHAAPPRAPPNGAGAAAPGALPVAGTAEENNNLSDFTRAYLLRFHKRGGTSKYWRLCRLSSQPCQPAFGMTSCSECAIAPPYRVDPLKAKEP
ncbi:uncharacterized protein LACBIDRAFT_296559 [Laccaria bicolor S238N-H82]|uniref:Predicted protein n=1 Tax=Laccaria bicolor (strain S238N-H82 / ATCC MYA-4686) TaxID=486041 RepID=B0D940_LACBS|nr:uncharacterized protein LACBIDRAFT_296559 [Laccaria bicolor S238N-H82]EDR09189.1 predicted protein [Laccaria bicolor S238N-H82]|eukprot:XP_001880502.1 predicted protein [Laccaria bicolor S238N-H82]